MTGYTPRRGSVPAMVIDHLKTLPAGTALTAKEVSVLTKLTHKNVYPILISAIQNGALEAVVNHEGLKAFCLGTGIKAERSRKSQKAETAAPSEHSDEEPATTRSMSFAIWSDGDVSLFNATLADDDTTVLITREQMTQLLRAYPSNPDFAFPNEHFFTTHR